MYRRYSLAYGGLASRFPYTESLSKPSASAMELLSAELRYARHRGSMCQIETHPEARGMRNRSPKRRSPRLKRENETPLRRRSSTPKTSGTNSDWQSALRASHSDSE